MASCLSVKPHLEGEEAEHGNHHDQARGSRVVVGEQIGEARIRQAIKGHGEKMYKGSCNQDASSKVLAHEKDLCRHLDPFHLLCHDGESSAEDREEQDQDYIPAIVSNVSLFINDCMSDLHKAAT